MNTKEFVEKLLNSGNKILEASHNAFQKYKKMKHCKQNLEFLLQFNIVYLRYRPEKEAVMKEIVCTSDTKFIEVFSALKLSAKKKALRKAKNSGIYTKNPRSILTYDLLECKYNTVALNNWTVIPIFEITPENIEILDAFINDLLKRPIEDDLNENASHKNKNKSK